jgi:HEPN domain-containing protein
MNDPFIRLMMKAAEQRLTSGKVLFHGKAFLDAMYLAGYGIECSLKALLLARTPKSKRAKILTQAFQGKAGHSFENLKALLGRQGVAFPMDISKQLRKVTSWSTDLRYRVGRGSSEDSREFIAAVEKIITWARRQI